MESPVRPGGSARRLSVGGKFATAIGALVLGVLVVAGVGAAGLAQLKADIERLGGHNLATIAAAADLSAALYEVQEVALEEVSTTRPETGERLGADLDQTLVPAARQAILTLRDEVHDPRAEGKLNQIQRDLDRYLRVRLDAGRPATGSIRDRTARATLSGRVGALFDRMTATAEALRVNEAEEAAESAQEAIASYRSTRGLLAAGAAASFLLGLLVVLLLVRSLVPRIRQYSRFAAAVAAGRRVDPLLPRGTDELADLGRALDHMVARSEAARLLDDDQAEFADTLQVTATEDEAHELVQRHLERSLPDTAAVVLKRNNSENRLDAATALTPGTAMVSRLVGAEPRSCLALRFGRTHREDPGRPPLVSCALCADPASRTTCEPLLVGGQVIGSVLVAHRQPLEPEQDARIKNSVAQAAPVLANLRNLALAEFRANNDSLTGLPNKRATDDTLKRMVAQANRSVTPLAALMLDLDQFKQVNDRFGHAKGDEVLAAVGAALRSSLRAGNFAGRFGGEELLVLLPDTTAEDALVVAEKMRGMIAAISVPGVERGITVSIGVADLIQHSDAPGLLRQADRALYAAKAAGRNRTVVAPRGDGPQAAAAPSSDGAGADRPAGGGATADRLPGGGAADGPADPVPSGTADRATVKRPAGGAGGDPVPSGTAAAATGSADPSR